jgi:hypothetical protein
MLRSIRAGRASAGPGWQQVARCLIIALGVASTLAPPRAADAMTPIRNAWFAEIFSADPRALPAGVEIVPLPAESNGDSGLEIRNTSDTPLYLLWDSVSYGREWGTRPLPPDIADDQLPPGTVAFQKAQFGQAFTWVTNVCTGDTCDPRWLEMRLNSGITVDRRTMYSVVSGLENRNKVEFGVEGEPRPANIRLPDSQHSSLTLMYGTDSVTVPITLTYGINPKYEEVRASIQAGQWIWLGIAVVFLGVLLAMMIGFVWVIVRIGAWAVRRQQARSEPRTG